LTGRVKRGIDPGIESEKRAPEFFDGSFLERFEQIELQQLAGFGNE
jgi:hypothetical protein